MTVVVTGGAGYIGAHVADALEASGEHVVLVDDLSTSFRERALGRTLVELDLASSFAGRELAEILGDHGADGVVHLAAKKQVGESVSRPEWYFAQNVGGLATVLTAMRAADCRRLVFSSSAAVYGEPDVGVVGEETAPRPINPYGETKLVGEWMVRDAARAWGLRQVSLRYFNVAGAGRPELGDPAVLNLVTMVFDRLEQGLRPLLFGDDYPTADGTCVRDFVHVQDLAAAHVAALAGLDSAPGRHDVFNVGTGQGASVRDVLDAIGRATGKDTTPDVRPRRAGDPAILVARPDRLHETLGWSAQFDLDSIVATAWAAWRAQRAAGIVPVRAAAAG